MTSRADLDGHGPAIAAITRVLTREDGADADSTARHILTALMGIGWRHAIHPPPPATMPAPPTEEFLAARAAIQTGEK